MTTARQTRPERERDDVRLEAPLGRWPPEQVALCADAKATWGNEKGAMLGLERARAPTGRFSNHPVRPEPGEASLVLSGKWAASDGAYPSQRGQLTRHQGGRD